MYMLVLFCFWCAATVIYADLAIVSLPEDMVSYWFFFGALLLISSLFVIAT